MMNRHEHMDAVSALGEVQRVERDVRARSRWQGWLWLLIAVTTPVFLIGTLAWEGLPSLAIAVGFMSVAALAWLWESRQTVVGRTGALIDRPMTYAYIGFIALAAMLRMFVLPDHLSTGNLVVALLPSLPCLFAAWLVFRR